MKTLRTYGCCVESPTSLVIVDLDKPNTKDPLEMLANKFRIFSSLVNKIVFGNSKVELQRFESTEREVVELPKSKTTVPFELAIFSNTFVMLPENV